MKYVWVIGSEAPNTDRGKVIRAHISEGLGYYQLNKSRKRNENINYAFRMATTRPVPSHLMEAQKYQVDKLEKLYDIRHPHKQIT